MSNFPRWAFIALLAAGQAVAADTEGDRAASFRLAGEILLTPPASPGSASNSASSRATDNRERAKSYQSESTRPSTTGTTVIIVPEGEDGMLSPRGAPLPDNRSKARDYQRGSNTGTAPLILMTPERRDAGAPETPREKLEENRSKARTYMKGESPFGATGDKIPVVSCRDVENSTGRIGDDSQSGSVITIMRDGRAYKVRCK